MQIGAMLRKGASSAYYSVWPRLRPKGYLARLTAAFDERGSLEWDSPEAIWCRQKDKINALLDHATRNVPYYRNLAKEGRMPRRIERPEYMTDIPVLTKNILRQQGEDLVAENFPRGRMRPNATGGSTGTPVHFWVDETSSLLANAGEVWATTLAGLDMRNSLAFLWGAGRFERVADKDLRDSLQRLITNRIFLNCFRMGKEDMRRAHRRLSRFRPDGFVGYTSALVELAAFLRHEGLKPNYPRKAVLSAAETLDETSRRQLETVFAVPVYDRYGSREIGLIAMECDRHQGLHIDCENVYVELIDDPDGSGMQRILVTRLNQFSMPFIRYDIEDLAEGPLSCCSCGRGYPVLKRVVGRVTEMIRMPDGGCLPGELFPHLFKDCGIASYRVVQAEDYSLDVAMVRAPSQTPEQDQMLRRVILEHVGPSMPVKIRYVGRIERSATGKLLPVISHAPLARGQRKTGVG